MSDSASDQTDPNATPPGVPPPEAANAGRRRWFRSDDEFARVTLPGWISAITGVIAVVAGVWIGYVQIRDARSAPPSAAETEAKGPSVTADPAGWVAEGDGTFTVMAPPEWVGERSYELTQERSRIPGGGTGSAFALSTDVERHNESFVGVSGVFLLASRDLLDIAGVNDPDLAYDRLLAWLEETYAWGIDCDPDATVTSYANERYSGPQRHWQGCGEGGGTFYELALAPPDLSHILYVQLTPGDVTDEQRLVEDFLATVQVDPSGIPGAPSSGDFRVD